MRNLLPSQVDFALRIFGEHGDVALLHFPWTVSHPAGCLTNLTLQDHRKLTCNMMFFKSRSWTPMYFQHIYSSLYYTYTYNIYITTYCEAVNL